MKVRAIERGFYGSLREPGETFELRDKADLSKRWMEPVAEEKAKADKKEVEPKQ